MIDTGDGDAACELVRARCVPTGGARRATPRVCAGPSGHWRRRPGRAQESDGALRVRLARARESDGARSGFGRRAGWRCGGALSGRRRASAPDGLAKVGGRVDADQGAVDADHGAVDAGEGAGDGDVGGAARCSGPSSRGRGARRRGCCRRGHRRSRARPRACPARAAHNRRNDTAAAERLYRSPRLCGAARRSRPHDRGRGRVGQRRRPARWLRRGRRALPRSPRAGADERRPLGGDGVVQPRRTRCTLRRRRCRVAVHRRRARRVRGDRPP